MINQSVQHFARQICNEIINFVVFCAVAIPDALLFTIVVTEHLCAGHERMQQASGLADISFCYERLGVCCQWFLGCELIKSVHQDDSGMALLL